MTTTHFETLTEGRAHLKDLLDAAQEGRPASLRRDSLRAAIVDAARLRANLTESRRANAQVVAEADGWSVLLPGLPIAADGATLDEALDETVDALREYAQDWSDRLLHATNHARNWDLVQIIDLSTDDELRVWLTGQ